MPAGLDNQQTSQKFTDFYKKLYKIYKILLALFAEF